MTNATSCPSTKSHAVAVSVRGVGHKYRRRDSSGLYIPEWTLKRGEQIFLHGESGSGKSTLLNLLSGVLTPTVGSIQLLGQPFSEKSSRWRDSFRAQHIGVVFQKLNLIPYLSVQQNIQLAAYFGKSGVDNLEEKALQLLLKLQLPESTLHRRARELSVGQQQRVAIARALINAPELLLVDEPTSALDSSARNAFMDTLTELCQDGETTMVFVSHDMYLERFFENSTSMSSLCQSWGNTKC